MSKIMEGLRNKMVDLLVSAIDNKLDGAVLTKGLDKILDKKFGKKFSEHFQRTLVVNTLLEMGAGAYSESPTDWADRLECEVKKIRTQK